MPKKRFDPYRLDRGLMKEAAAETLAMRKLGFGPYRARLEAALARFIGRKYCLLTTSGREALSLAAGALRPAGGAAAFPDITHPSLAEAALDRGFRLRPLDIDPETLNLSVKELKRAAGGLSLLLLPHMFGTPGPIKEAMRLAKLRGFAVIEDASQIIGGGGRKKYGSYGDIGVFSLSPYKPVSSPFCRAGALLCDSARLLGRITALRPPDPKPEALPFISLKLSLLKRTMAGVRAANAVYRRELAGLEKYFPAGLSCDAQEFPLILPRRAAAEAAFKKAGIPLERAYRPLHLEQGLPGKFPAADRYWKGAVHLPAWPQMTEAECREAAAAARRALAD